MKRIAFWIAGAIDTLAIAGCAAVVACKLN